MKQKSIHQNFFRRALTPVGMNMTRWAVMLGAVVITLFALPTRIDKPTKKGLYIRDGQKVVIK